MNQCPAPSPVGASTADGLRICTCSWDAFLRFFGPIAVRAGLIRIITSTLRVRLSYFKQQMRERQCANIGASNGRRELSNLSHVSNRSVCPTNNLSSYLTMHLSVYPSFCLIYLSIHLCIPVFNFSNRPSL